MKKLISIFLVCIFALGLASCGKTGDKAVNDHKYTDTPTNVVDIIMEDGSYITVELDESVAPITVKNFKKLVSEGFYDGLIFHRVIKDFMIQGGDPTGTGMGGSEETIKGEFLNNGVVNTLSHQRGVISMARTNDPNSASSQFFICHADATSLDGSYAAFGKVIEGMETVDKIACVETDANNKPVKEQKIKTIKFVDNGAETTAQGNETAADTDKTTDTVDNTTDSVTADSYTASDVVEIVMEDGGIIKVELYGDVAPITVANFKKLVSEGFYDGLIFHRIISGYVIQGGDPTGTGMGGSKETIKGEFAMNGIDNPINHERGIISMARSTAFDSASSQFFICHADAPHLNGSYAAFGKVIEGMDVVDKIASVETGASDRPLVEQKINTIRFVEE